MLSKDLNTGIDTLRLHDGWCSEEGRVENLTRALVDHVTSQMYDMTTQEHIMGSIACRTRKWSSAKKESVIFQRGQLSIWSPESEESSWTNDQTSSSKTAGCFMVADMYIDCNIL